MQIVYKNAEPNIKFGTLNTDTADSNAIYALSVMYPKTCSILPLDFVMTSPKKPATFSKLILQNTLIFGLKRLYLRFSQLSYCPSPAKMNPLLGSTTEFVFADDEVMLKKLYGLA